MPPAAVCHLSAAGTPTASWFTSLFGSQCLLRLSATSAPRALQPRPGTGTMPTSTPEASWRGEGDIYRPFGTGTLNRTTSGAGSRGKTVWNRCQTGLLPMLRPDFGTASPARGLSVASRRGEGDIYRPFGTGTMPTSTPEASWRGEGDIYRPFDTGTLSTRGSVPSPRAKASPNRPQTALTPVFLPALATVTLPTMPSVPPPRAKADIYRPFGTGTISRTTSGAGSRGKTVWNRCQTGLLPMLRPDFGTASPARGLSVASRRGEVVIYRLFIHKMPLFHGY